MLTYIQNETKKKASFEKQAFQKGMQKDEFLTWSLQEQHPRCMLLNA